MDKTYYNNYLAEYIEGNNLVSIDTKALKPGVYFVELSTNSNKIYKKFTKL
ncbi:MAG: T9SS type A sorting domain-containing protein [Bacteroidota bacterium]|nr:T9SS type A sorting domain-containing protein [Bacteroidota bacterium]